MADSELFSMRQLELLAPAANKEIAIEAILHGADAVYIGAPSHGARKNAANSLGDIAELVSFAHRFRARIYVTVNTLVYDSEIESVEKMIRELYECGVDAIIVQDMGILRMNLPPIELHASTQCDTRDVSKAKFLEECGFSQIVLARELATDEIKNICEHVDVPIECFIHGALCVSYSGRCRASMVSTGRSANRGECAQMCRLPYNLLDANGCKLLVNRYLLSLKDFNASDYIEKLIEAGVSSFKIEGRLKDADYVKNVTAYYRKLIDDIISRFPEKYRRSSYGKSEISFIPDTSKSFNRGFTSYFLEGRRQKSMASLLTPKSMGEEIHNVNELNNGDGISFFNTTGEYEGVRVNRIENGRIVGAKPFKLPANCTIHRTYDREWQSKLEKQTAKRYIEVDMVIDETGISATDERGVSVRINLDVNKSIAEKKMEPEKILGKLGNTIYRLRKFTNLLDEATFIPASELNVLKRSIIEALDKTAEATYPIRFRKRENKNAKYLLQELQAEDNVANRLAVDFYSEHGAKTRAKAIEVGGKPHGETVVMETRYCIRRELGICKKHHIKSPHPFDNAREPFYIQNSNNKFRLDFDCAKCEMRVVEIAGK